MTLSGTHGSNMNAFWWVVREIYSWRETLTKNFEVNSTNKTESNERTNEWTNKQTNIKRRGESYIPPGIYAGGYKDRVQRWPFVEIPVYLNKKKWRVHFEQEGHEALNRSPEYTGQSQTFNFEIWMSFGQGQRMTMTFDTHSTSLTHLAECFKWLWDLRLQ